MTHPIAEIVTFTLTPGISDPEFLALSQSSEAFCKSYPGFLARRVSRAPGGRWTDYVLWADLDTAQAAAAAFSKQDFAPAMMAAIAPDSVTMRHEEVLWQV